MKRLVIIAIAAIALAPSVHAETSAGTFLAAARGGDFEPANQYITALLEGISYGASTFPTILASRGKPGVRPLFCMAESTPLSKDLGYNVVQRMVQRHPQMAGDPVGAVLMLGLMDEFPCK